MLMGIKSVKSEDDKIVSDPDTVIVHQENNGNIVVYFEISILLVKRPS